MKQIIINADDETHAWLAAQAKEQCRSIGNQALFLLGLKRPAKLQERNRISREHLAFIKRLEGESKA